MKPAEKARLEKIALEILCYTGKDARARAFCVLRDLLKEQDRKTRHACAEAALSIDNPFVQPYATIGDSCKDHGFEEAKKAAHAACMNAQVVWGKPPIEPARQTC